MVDKISRYDNVRTEVANGEVLIRINIRENEVDVQPSASGKTMVIATTGGAMRLNGTPLKLNLTLYRKP